MCYTVAGLHACQTVCEADLTFVQPQHCQGYPHVPFVPGLCHADFDGNHPSSS